jgi:hypothetical protein
MAGTRVCGSHNLVQECRNHRVENVIGYSRRDEGDGQGSDESCLPT